MEFRSIIPRMRLLMAQAGPWSRIGMVAQSVIDQARIIARWERD